MNINKGFIIEISSLIFIIVGVPFIYANANDTNIISPPNNSDGDNASPYNFGVKNGDVIVLEITRLNYINYTRNDWITQMKVSDEQRHEIKGLGTYQEEGSDEIEEIDGVSMLYTDDYGGYDNYGIYYKNSIAIEPDPVLYHTNWSEIESRIHDYETQLKVNFGALNVSVVTINQANFEVNYSFIIETHENNTLIYTVLNKYDKSTGIRIFQNFNMSQEFEDVKSWTYEYTLELKTLIEGQENTALLINNFGLIIVTVLLCTFSARITRRNSKLY